MLQVGTIFGMKRADQRNILLLLDVYGKSSGREWAMCMQYLEISATQFPPYKWIKLGIAIAVRLT